MVDVFVRQRLRSLDIQESLTVEPLFLHMPKSQLRWLGDFTRMTPGHLLSEVLQTCPTGKRGPRADTLESFYLLALGV